MATEEKASVKNGVDPGYWERVAEAVTKQDEEDAYIPFNPEDELYDPNDDEAVEAFFNASEAFHKELRAAGIQVDDHEAVQRYKELRDAKLAKQAAEAASHTPLV